MNKTIIITTDFSEESLAAFPSAIEQAKLYGKDNVKVILLNVFEDKIRTNVSFGYGFAAIDIEGLYEHVFKETVKKTEQIALDNFKGIEVEPLVIPATGPIYHSIINFADNENADLIVISSHGRTGLKHLFLGSVAERVIREAHCPVLIVPAYARTIQPVKDN